MSRDHSVAFRFFSEDISPDAMTERIGIEPTDVRTAGEKRISWRPRGPANRWSANMWGYHPDYDRSLPLEGQLKLLFQELAPNKERMRDLAREAKAICWCACFSSDLETTMELSPETLAEMASYGATLSLSHYRSDDEDDPD